MVWLFPKYLIIILYLKLTKNNSFLNLCYSVTCTVKLQKCCPVDTGYEQLIFYCLFWFYQAPYTIGIANLANQHHYQTGLDCVQESIEILESSVLQESDEIASTSATIDLAEDSRLVGSLLVTSLRRCTMHRSFDQSGWLIQCWNLSLFNRQTEAKRPIADTVSESWREVWLVMKIHATNELHKKNVKVALGQLTVEGAVGNEQRREKEKW